MAKKKAKDATKKINIFTLIFGVLMGILALPIIIIIIIIAHKNKKKYINNSHYYKKNKRFKI